MDQMNEQLFKPRGLYALIMTYTPDAHEKPIGTQQMNINEIISGRQKPSWNVKGRPLTKGDTYGELELPEAAHLVFPGIDQATQEKLVNESAWKKSRRFLSNHHDMGCQARWVSFALLASLSYSQLTHCSLSNILKAVSTYHRNDCHSSRPSLGTQTIRLSPVDL